MKSKSREKALMAIVGSPEEEDSPASASEESDVDTADEDAAQAAIEALKEGDAAGFLAAFKTMYALCKAQDEEDEGSSEEEPY